jgi:hypothetical protein
MVSNVLARKEGLGTSLLSRRFYERESSDVCGWGGACGLSDATEGVARMANLVTRLVMVTGKGTRSVYGKGSHHVKIR